MADQDRKCRVCGIVIEQTNDGRVCYKCRNEKRQKASEGSVESFLEHKLTTAKSRAKKAEQEFSITHEELMEMYEIQDGYCALSGLPMTNSRENSDLSISIDRIDNNAGYTVDNVRLVCWRANSMRYKLTVEMFLWWCRQIAKD